MKNISDFPRLHLGQLPTPLHRLDNISRELNKNVYVKRDDMTGVALGGNKVRKLEFLLADAISKGCDTVLTTGGEQSNHAMLTAACCNKLGLDAILVLKAMPEGAPGRCTGERRGNLVLDELMGARVSMVRAHDYDEIYDVMEKECDALRKSGRHPYVIPLGGSVALGSLGYVECMREIAVQAQAMGLNIQNIVCAAGSGGTLAGTTLGADLFLPGAKVHGIAVGEDDFDAITAKLIAETAAILDVRCTARPDILPFYGDGYAIPSAEGNRAVRLMAQREGIILDPVYTGKMFAGLLELDARGAFDTEGDLLMLHSGGAGGVFAIDID